MPYRHRNSRRLVLAYITWAYTLYLSPHILLAGSLKSTGQAAGATAAVATIPLKTETVCMGPLGNSADLTAIVDDYRNGDWQELQKKLGTISEALRDPNGFTTCKTIGLSKQDRISFVFLNEVDAQPTIVRVLQGESPEPSPGSLRLIGARSFYSVYLFRNAGTPPIVSTYTASPSPSPVQAGLAQIIPTAAGGIGKLVAPAPVPSPGRVAGPNLVTLLPDLHGTLSERLHPSRNRRRGPLAPHGPCTPRVTTCICGVLVALSALVA